MALKSTICKVTLQVADMDRHYYAEHALRVARHPSETDERMMVRILAFALNASESLQFGRGLSDTDDPDLSQRDLTGSIETWIEVGQPDDRAILKACGRADRVIVYPYGNGTPIWWRAMESKVERARNLSVVAVVPEAATKLAGLADRAMNLQCTIHDGEVWMRDDNDREVQILLKPLMVPRAV
jgi:uncharacterized protein YaeQ